MAHMGSPGSALPALLLSCALALVLLHSNDIEAGFACLSSPCVYGVCMDDLNSSFTCYCIDGYTGALCQTNWDECWSSPCLNGATCVDGVASFNCTCPDGFVGDLCELDVNECLSNPCLNKGTCLDGPNGYACMCLPGYSGDRCELDEAVCNATAEARCHNGGACQEGPGMDFSCACQPGWTGELCDEPVNECESSPCQHGGVCVDLHAAYACACLFGYTGRHCEHELEPCARNPCLNGALCLLEGGVDVCYCVPDYHGDRCQLQYDECRRGPGCQNGGTCIDGVDEFSCSCPPGLSGEQCQCVLQHGPQGEMLNCSSAARPTTTQSTRITTTTMPTPSTSRAKPSTGRGGLGTVTPWHWSADPATRTSTTPTRFWPTSSPSWTRPAPKTTPKTQKPRKPTPKPGPAPSRTTTTPKPGTSPAATTTPRRKPTPRTTTPVQIRPGGTTSWPQVPSSDRYPPTTTSTPSTTSNVSAPSTSTIGDDSSLWTVTLTTDGGGLASDLPPWVTAVWATTPAGPESLTSPWTTTAFPTTQTTFASSGDSSTITSTGTASVSSPHPYTTTSGRDEEEAEKAPDVTASTSPTPSSSSSGEVSSSGTAVDTTTRKDDSAVYATRDPKAIPVASTTTSTSAMTPHAQLVPGQSATSTTASSGSVVSAGGAQSTVTVTSSTEPGLEAAATTVTDAAITDFLWTTRPPESVPSTVSHSSAATPLGITTPATTVLDASTGTSATVMLTTPTAAESTMGGDIDGEVPSTTSFVLEANVTDCSGSPCLNGATCEDAVDAEDGVRCLCAFGWTGPHCDEKVQVAAAAFSGHSFLEHRLPGAVGGVLGSHVAVRARTLAPTGMLLHAALAPELYMTLYLEDGLLKFQFSCGVQTMVFSEVQHRVNNGFDLHIAASLEVLPLRGAMRPCVAALHVNHSLAMSGEQQSVADRNHQDHEVRDVRLYLGGLPGHLLHGLADHPGGLVGGLVGCMLGLEVNGSPRRIYEDAADGGEVSECAALACLSAPCQSGGTCVQEGQRWTCLCPSGYVGSTCEISVCRNNPCKFGGTCVPFPASGFLCLCPLGKHGLFCESDLEIAQPSFSPSVAGLSSFAAYTLPVAVEDALELRFRFLPTTQDQVGLVLFLGQDGVHDSTSDHLAVSFIKGYVVLTWNLGSGPRRIFTPRPLEPRPGRPYSVRVGRLGSSAWLMADGMSNVTGTSPGPLRQLNTVPMLYIGGHNAANFSGLPHDLPLHSGFAGCVLDLELIAGTGPTRVAVALERARAVEGRAVGQCGTTLCHARACQHRAACLHHAATFSCLCPDGWFGPVCAQRFNPCDTTRNNCSSGSTCVPLRDGGYECDCPFGRTGRHCEKEDAPSDVLLSGHRSFLSLGRVDLQRGQSCVGVDVRPLADDGLLLFVGVVGQGPGPETPSLALVLRGGLLEARLAGAGGARRGRAGRALTLRSRRVLAREDWHRVRVCRYGRRLFLWVDGSAQSAALRPAQRLPPAGATLHIGGAPDLSTLPSALGLVGGPAVPLRGCVRGLSVNWRLMPLDAAHVVKGRNVEDCDGTACGGDVCLHGGSCWLGDGGGAYCTCAQGYSGQHCERQLSCVDEELRCRNRGRCVAARCHCPAGWGGAFCEEEVTLGTPHFGGEGYLKLDAENQQHADDAEGFGRSSRMRVRAERSADISFLYLNFSTAQDNGMILWSAQDDELLGVGVEAGRLKVVWGWRGAGVFVAEVPGPAVSDGAWHDLALSFGPNVTMWTDGSPEPLNRAAALPRPISTGGVFYIGGFPSNKSVVLETRGIFNMPFSGCLQQLSWNQDSSVTDFTGYQGENVGNCELF